jgi:hypothetical protein
MARQEACALSRSFELARRARNVDQDQALVYSEVFEVLGVEGGQRQSLDDAARGDPRVIDWARTAAKLGARLEMPPGDRYPFVELKQDGPMAPRLQTGPPLGSPAPDFRPLRQFAQSYERDAGRDRG